MDLVLVAALAFGLGLLAGLAAGAARAFALAARRRAIAGTSGALARIWPDSLPQRSAADILAMAKTKGELTTQQEARIKGLKTADATDVSPNNEHGA